jgi:hypothetical protein
MGNVTEITISPVGVRKLLPAQLWICWAILSFNYHDIYWRNVTWCRQHVAKLTFPLASTVRHWSLSPQDLSYLAINKLITHKHVIYEVRLLVRSFIWTATTKQQACTHHNDDAQSQQCSCSFILHFKYECGTNIHVWGTAVSAQLHPNGHHKIASLYTS